MGINKVILIGNVGKAPEVKTLSEDLKVASFSLATSETFKNKNGEKVTNTEWHNIIVWRGLASVVEKYVEKGDSIYIEGKITTESYEKDGIKKYVTKIIANNLQMLGSKQKTESPSKEENGNSAPPNGEDDLPF